MTFLHPVILAAGSAAVAIPILIHLLMRRRRVPVPWGAMRFVLEAYKRTRRRLIVQKWLLLAARCLLVLLLAVFIARPMLGSGSGVSAGSRRVHIILDNSIASRISIDGRTAFSRHVQAARQVLATLGEGDQASLLITGSPDREVVWPASSNLAGVSEALANITPTDVAADLRQCMTLIAAGSGAPAIGGEYVVLISDLPVGAADLRNPLPKLPPSARLLATKPGRAATNTAIASVSPSLRYVLEAEQASQTVSITLERSGPGVGSAATSAVRLWSVPLSSPRPDIDTPAQGEQRVNVQWAAGQRRASVTAPMPTLPAGIAGDAAIVARIDADANDADDLFRLPIPARAALRVGLLADRTARRAIEGEAFTPAMWLAAAIRPTDNSPIDLLELDEHGLDQTSRATLDAIVLLSPNAIDAAGWTRLNAFVDAGGLLIVTPPADLDAHPWTETMTGSLRLPWTIARTPVTNTQPISAASPPGEAGAAADLLHSVRRELDDLVRPVAVLKTLPIMADSPAAPRSDGAAPPDASVGSTTATTTLLKLSDGTPLLSLSQRAPTPSAPAPGAVVYFACAFNSAWTDLMAKPLMVPLTQELIRQGVSASLGASWVIAGVPAPTPRGGSELAPLAPAGLPPPRAGNGGFLRAALLRASDARGMVRGHVAINADAAGSIADANEESALGAWLGQSVASPGAFAFIVDNAAPTGVVASGSVAKLLSPAQTGTPTSSLWLSAALAIAVIELTLARWASAPSQAAGGSLINSIAGKADDKAAAVNDAEVFNVASDAPKDGGRDA